MIDFDTIFTNFIRDRHESCFSDTRVDPFHHKIDELIFQTKVKTQQVFQKFIFIQFSKYVFIE